MAATVETCAESGAPSQTVGRERLTSANIALAGPCSRLMLGTAQLGMPYGVANIAGQPDLATVAGIVSAVWSRGVRLFDTAQAYGTSEAALGRAFASLSIGEEACVVSKLKVDLEPGNTDAILRSVEVSLKRLRIPRLWGILLHHEEQLDQWDGSVGKALGEAKRAGLVVHLGSSVYSPARALQALELEGLDLVQVPANVFDRRMARAGLFERARELDKTVFIRSVYLQGLALMPPAVVPQGIPMAAQAVAALSLFCAERQVDRRRFALDYVRHLAPDAMVIVGTETVAQAEENCSLFIAAPLDPAVHHAWTAQWPKDWDALIDPCGWARANRGRP